MKFKLSDMKMKLNKKQMILTIIIAAIIFISLLLIILWPSINQAIYNGKVEAIKNDAINQSETIKTKGLIGDNETLSVYLSRIKSIIDKMNVETRFADLNEDYKQVKKVTFEESGLLQYDQKADLMLNSFEVIKNTSDNISKLNDQFNSIIEQKNENMAEEIAQLSNSISSNKDILNNIKVEELKPVAESIIKIFDEFNSSIDKYKPLSSELDNFNQLYNTQVANMQSINSWEILRDNATIQEYKDMCQQKVDEFMNEAKSGIDNIKKIGENLQSYEDQFKNSYSILLKRLGINKVDYSTKKQIMSSIDSAKKLVFSE